MKKSIHPLIIILIIILLLMLIILPPTLRAFYPKIEKTEGSHSDKITLLVCKKESISQQLQVKSQTRYINNKIEENRITFSKLVAARTAEQMIIDESPTIIEELEFLKQIPNIDIKTTENETIITITKETLANTQDNQQLKDYYDNNINTQKINYVQKYYDCETTTN